MTLSDGIITGRGRIKQIYVPMITVKSVKEFIKELKDASMRISENGVLFIRLADIEILAGEKLLK